MFNCSSLPQAASDAANMIDVVINTLGPGPVALVAFVALVFAARRIF